MFVNCDWLIAHTCFCVVRSQLSVGFRHTTYNIVADLLHKIITYKHSIIIQSYFVLEIEMEGDREIEIERERENFGV